ncbi:hypothetical protein DIPPA_10101 [Diplonema papillatum]|nr:hypothetical protein DIPPA_10101 [Diplonema papillatum]
MPPGDECADEFLRAALRVKRRDHNALLDRRARERLEHEAALARQGRDQSLRQAAQAASSRRKVAAWREGSRPLPEKADGVQTHPSPPHQDPCSADRGDGALQVVCPSEIPDTREASGADSKSARKQHTARLAEALAQTVVLDMEAFVLSLPLPDRACAALAAPFCGDYTLPASLGEPPAAFARCLAAVLEEVHGLRGVRLSLSVRPVLSLLHDDKAPWAQDTWTLTGKPVEDFVFTARLNMIRVQYTIEESTNTQ